MESEKMTQDEELPEDQNEKTKKNLFDIQWYFID